MAGYGGRKSGVNVSQYIADLNKEPSAFELDRSVDDTFNLEDELAQFTNAEFLDFDAGPFLDGNAPSNMDFATDSPDGDVTKPEVGKPPGKGAGVDFAKGDYPMTGLYDLASPTSPSTPYKQPSHPTAYTDYHHAPLPFAPTTGLPYPYNAAGGPPNVAGAPTAALPRHHPHPSSASAASPTSVSVSGPGPATDDSARAAAEEDKRRRNTAASARFRVKKKEREKALERKTQELEKQNQTLEQRIGQLETENEWLRGLVVEKNGVGVGGGAMAGKNRERERERDREEKRRREREEGARKKGVGTGRTVAGAPTQHDEDDEAHDESEDVDVDVDGDGDSVTA